MKLISMTDFVLEIQTEVSKEDYQVVAWQTKIYSYDRINKYANFLKQPLTLGMFVPCDDDGNVLQQNCDVINEKCRDCSCREFQKAKSKVLFNNFEIKVRKFLDNSYRVVKNKDTYVFYFDEEQKKWIKVNDYSIIEHLCFYRPDLAVSF